MLRQILASGDRFLVVRRRAGLGDCILAVANGWKYCRQTGRTLLVDLSQSKYFAAPEQNAASELFDLPSQLGGTRIVVPAQFSWALQKALRLPTAVRWLFLRYPPTLMVYDWILVYLCRRPKGLASDEGMPEEEERELARSGRDLRATIVSFSGCYGGTLDAIRPFLRALRPHPLIQQRVDAFTREIGQAFVGVHVRYYGPELPPSNHSPFWIDFEKAIEEIVRSIVDARNDLGAGSPIFLATDSQEVETALRGAGIDFVTHAKDFGVAGQNELHERGLEGAGVDAVTEMFVLAQSSILVRYPPHGSWFSEVAAAHHHPGPSGPTLTPGPQDAPSEDLVEFGI